MQRIAYLLIFCLFSFWASGQKTVTQGEYYWDTDPGQGNGFPLMALDGNFDKAVEELFKYGASTAGLTHGPHSLRIRFKGQDGTWSADYKYTVVVQQYANSRNARIVQGEYYWDTDPGQGNGIPLLATDGSFNSVVENLSKNADASVLSLGPHSLAVRIKGLDGQWSAVFRQTVYVECVTPSAPSVSIAVIGDLCTSTVPQFEASTVNGGTTPVYQWKVNGINAGTNSPTYSDPALINGDIVTCELTSNSTCATTPNANSNSIVVALGTPLIPTVSIAISTTDTLCFGSSLTFTATVANEGTSPAYIWQINGLNTPFNGPSLTIGTLLNNDIVSCQLISSAACASPAAVTSSGITVNVINKLNPAITIAASATTICAGMNVTFTANTVDQGSSPTYQWKVNGVNVGSNSNTFTSSTLVNGDDVTCVLTVAETCVNASSATSNVISITIPAALAPSLTIAKTPAGSVCQGSDVLFTASPSSIGESPSYQWYLNGSPVGGDSMTYSYNGFANGDVVYCTVTSSSLCETGVVATSNNVTMAVTVPVTPSVSISTSSTTVCSGYSTTFTATPTNGGTPTYQWKVNGVNVGTNSSVYNTTTLATGDVVTCSMTTSLTCVTATSATSNSITMTVTPSTPASVSIAANPGSSVCAGTSVTFTATPTYGGTPSYQWQLNGANAGTNSDTYTATLANGNTVRCYMTSTATCPTPVTSLSNVITMTVTANVTPTASISVSPGSTICAGTNVTFTATGSNLGATPTYQWYLNGSPVGTNSNTYSNNALVSGNTVNCIVTSSVTCVTSPTATSNTVTMTVNTPVTPAVSISASSSTICAGSNVTFTATPTNGGTPTYQWKLNGANVGTNSTTYSNAALVNGDVITCVMTSSLSCVTSATATSNAVTMTVNPINATSVSIVSSGGSSICAGQSVTFTATPTNGGTPTYQWQLNGSNVGTNSDTYTSSSLVNGNTVRCLMTSSLGCTSPATATSNVITMTVTANVTPSVSISRTPTGTICEGTNVTFTASPTNGGATPAYQWYLNGSPVGTNSAAYSNNTLTNGNTVSCVMTSSVTCVTSSTATSNTITMSTIVPVTPAVSISASGTTICAGTNVTFTATPTNGGTPTYQWKLNGTNVGTNSSTYSNSGLVNGDVVTCVMTSSVSCVTSSTATSNAVTMTVNPINATSVSIAANPGASICAGSSVTFTATPTNGGTPTYQWQVNGSNVGTNSDTYITSALVNGNTVRCLMTSSLGCTSPSTATSNVITMTVTANVTPTASISANPGSTVCNGTNVTFTTTGSNLGATPAYQWYLDGSPVGTNNSTYTNGTLSSGNTINCVVTSSVTCVTSPTATSNTVTMTVNTPVTPAVSVTASATTVCSGTNVTFTATPTNGGIPSYQWFVNGSPVGTNSATYSSTGLTNGDVVTCTLTSSLTCVTASTANSNSITMSVSSSFPASVSISSNPGSTICTGTSVTFTATPTNGGTPSYQWLLNGSPVGTNSNTYTNATLSNGNVVSCQMTSSISCAVPAVSSNSVTMTVNAIVTPAVTVSPSTGTTVCGGTNVTFTATPTNGGATPAYQWYLNGSPVGTNSPSYSNSTLTNGDNVYCVLTSSLMCLTTPTGTSNTVTMTVTTPLTPAVSISASASTICNGTSVTFTATPTNGGVPDYQWYRNGSPVGANSSTYSSSSLNNNDVVTCVLISTLTCVTSSTATSNSITMTVNPLISNSVSISSSTGSTSCYGSNVVFTATPVNGGASPSYTWYVNGIPEWSGSPYVTSSLTTGDVVTCEMSSSLTCASPSTVTSNVITMTVYSTNAPTASISSNQGSGICAGGTINFSATGINIGTSPTYQWYLNGSPAGTNNPNYSISNPADGNTVYCIVTSNAPCVSGQTATSNVITINVNTPVTPTISISTADAQVCAGTSVTFTASTTNGGGAPNYQWYKNGSPVGSGNNTYTTSSLNNGDVITCTLTSSLSCVTTSSASSNSVTMTVGSSIPTAVSISSSTGSTSCSGSNVIFTATPTNGGTSPSYQWYVNGSPVGLNSSGYVTSSLTTGDVVSCQMMSTYGCASPAAASSNTITITVYSTNPPAASVSSDLGAGVCPGGTVNFSASGVNIGALPSYQWYLNGSPVGTNSSAYSVSGPVNGSTVYCVITSNATCVSGQTATSNTITINHVSPVAPAVSISASATTVCAGTSVTFTASPTNEGGSPSYQWYKNGSPVGFSSSTYTSSSLNNGDIITCTLTSSLSCVTSSSANSNSISMTVNPTAVTSVSITSSMGSTSCSGQSVTFTATATNGGTPAYQWYVNGSPVGTNSATYLTSTLSDGNTISCAMTSSLGCPSPATATSNVITMTVNPTVTPTVSITANPGNTICGGTNVTFTASATNEGSSPTYQWYLNGSPVGTNSTTYSNSSLLNGNTVYCVVTSSTPCVTGPIASSNTITMNVTTPLAPSVSISASATSICPGTNVTFTASTTNGGGSPGYQWKVNGSNVGTNSSTFSSSSLNNGDVVTCVLTTSLSCVTSSSVNSNGITITVNPTTISSVSISSSEGATICSGTSVTFTASTTNGGTPTYQWYLNGSPVGTNSATFVTSTLNTNDAVSCEMVSSLPCNSPAVANSNVIVMTVNSTAMPTVAIASNQGSSICGGTTVTFTATATNGGSLPVYQWLLNGSPVGTNSSAYSNGSLINGDVISCMVTSNAPCVNGSTATSNSITINVTTPVTPAVSISASATTICAGTNVTFTATPTNGGTPAYQWFVNGSSSGTGSTFATSTLNNSDVVTCTMTTSLTCVTASSATSNGITMAVNPVVATAVSISSNAGSIICSGTSVTFTATPTNGGTPLYQWLVNGLPVGTNSANYVTSALNNGDIVTCEMSSSLSCPSPATALSNSITMTVNSTSTPTISISSNNGNTICEGSGTVFTAVITNGGTAPVYQWLLNGSPVGMNSATYNNSALANNDVVSCVLTSNATCPTITTVTSNQITMTVNAVVTTSVSINASATTICSGTNVTFTAIPTNGGTPAYQWFVNSSPVGTNSGVYTNSTLTNGQTVTCQMTSSLSCATPATASSNVITMTVNSTATPTISITSNPSASTICSGTSVTFTANITNGGSSPVYQWKLNGSPVGTNSSTYTNTTLATGDAVTCELTSNAPCVSTTTVTSNSISKTVNPSVTPTITITSNPTMPVCEHQSVTFTATITNGGSSPSYQWKKNGQNYGINSPTYSTSVWNNGDVFTCVLTSNATCATSATVTSNAITTQEVVIDATTTVSGNTITANQAGATYQWFDCTFQTPINGATGQSYTVTETGLYSVQVTIGSCTEESGCEYVEFNEISDLTKAGIVLYPNPTTDNFTIELPADAHMEMKLYDVSGRIVQEGTLDGMVHQIDVRQLATGSYQIVLTNGENHYVGKVIVNRQ